MLNECMISRYSGSFATCIIMSPLQTIEPFQLSVGLVSPVRLSPTKSHTPCPSSGATCVGISGGPLLSQSYVISIFGWLQLVDSVAHIFTDCVLDSSIPKVDATMSNSSELSGDKPACIASLFSSIQCCKATAMSTSIVELDCEPVKLPTDIDGTLPPLSQ